MKHRTGTRWLVMLTALLITALVLVGCGGREEEQNQSHRPRCPC